MNASKHGISIAHDRFWKSSRYSGNQSSKGDSDSIEIGIEALESGENWTLTRCKTADHDPMYADRAVANAELKPTPPNRKGNASECQSFHSTCSISLQNRSYIHRSNSAAIGSKTFGATFRAK